MNVQIVFISRMIEWQVSLLLTKTRKRLKSRGNWMLRSRDFLPQLTESHDANRFQSNRSERIRRSGESSKNCKASAQERQAWRARGSGKGYHSANSCRGRSHP